MLFNKSKKRSESSLKKLKKLRRVEHEERRRRMPKQKPNRSVQVVGTPKDFFNALRNKFGRFVVDLAASKHNTKCKTWITVKQNTFTIDWSQYKGNLYLNPPFGKIPKFVKYCVRMAKKGAHIFMLVPASVGANWYRDYVWPNAYVWFLNGRIKFDGHAQGYPKDCMIVEFGGEKGYKQHQVKNGDHAIWNWKTGKVY